MKIVDTSKVTAYLMDGCGWCKEQIKHLSKNDKIINCSSKEGSENKVCQKIDAFPSLNINGKMYEGLHTKTEINNIKNKNKYII